MTNVEQTFVGQSSRIQDAMASLDRTGAGIVLVVTDHDRLLDTITDGDIRRAILGGLGVETPVSMLLARSRPADYPKPITARVGTPDVDLLRMMTEHTLRQIPLLDTDARVVDLALLSELIREHELPVSAMIMAGGFGQRLRPLTNETPKPMLQVGDKPLLEHILLQLSKAGIRRVHLSTHYKSEVISDHFKDGHDLGLRIDYIREREPLGTAGAVGLLDASSEPILVINGDILTKVDFRSMLLFHREHQAEMTVAVRQYEISVPYGIMETDGVRVTGVSEKPVIRQFINAGIYLLNPEICQLIPNDRPYDMPELIGRLIQDQRTVVSFPIHEYWLDIGRTEDYGQALVDISNGAV